MCGPPSLESILYRRICVQKTCSRPTTSYNICWRPFYHSFSPRRRKISVPQLVADPSVASGRRISPGTVRRRLYNSGLCARRPVVCVPLDRRLSWQENARQRWASVFFTHRREIQDVCSAGGNEAPDIINPTLLKDSVTEGVEQWFRQGSHSVVTLICMCSRKEL
ncbi:HTH_Tnp_Tc3_2 domain-containing protein [Trichonephila clavipes]|nr:HTH_Tnp_Tc3_2 domain-containing protein [Trichonephila clavipes]